jgi:tRNA pseudouridine55 synthase
VGLDGIVLIDKDEGMTSFETVRKTKSRLQATKAGHAGTLDKAASGLLIVLINRATALQNILMSNSKRYRATIQLGTETDTLDRYGRITKKKEVGTLSASGIERVLEGFQGEILQIPPLFSAIHHNGERLYKKALKGERPDVKPRRVVIEELGLAEHGETRLTIEVLASKGTYVRSLGRDIAEALGTCGYLSSLRRLEIGPFSVEDAVKLDETAGGITVTPLGEAFGYLPGMEVGDREASMILNGVPPVRVFSSWEEDTGSARFFRVLFQNRLIAIIEKGDSLRYFKVFKDLEVEYR